MISVVLATYNEEKNVRNCLESVAGFADEIIVVDGNSQDKTREIAKEMGARVIKTTNKPVFHINKQMAMDEAKGDLVLQMDADELVDEELASFIKETHQQIKTTKNKKDFPVKAWYINRKNHFLGRWLRKGGQYPDAVIRLYINGFARLPQKDVHEQMEVDGQTETAQGHLLHYAYPDIQTYMRKWNAYTSLKAAQLKEEGLKISFINSISYLIFKPLQTFLSLYVRHKGFVDLLPGFIFSLMSGLYHAVSYLKLWELYQTGKDYA